MSTSTGSATRIRRFIPVLAACLLLASACFGSRSGPDSDGGTAVAAPPDGSDFGNADARATMGQDTGEAGSPSDAAPTAPMADPCERIEVRSVDLLFMVDNSGSMREEQEALRREFPRMIRTLTTGDRDGDGEQDFPPVEDLHLGVVSSDMGLVGIQGIPRCEGLGDDGIMNNTASLAVTDCQPAYPRFLSYAAGVHDPEQTANDFACVATLGTEGCGFEQQLEATLKALWPSSDETITFLGDVNGFGRLGHGDQENAGFLRPAQGDEASVLAIVVVSDEEDCSSRDTRHFTPEVYLEPSDPLASQDLNLRCFHNPQNLYRVERYINGFKALRPGLEQLVVFGAIVGVPPELVSAAALDAVDFSDAAASDAFYDAILADDRMQEREDPDRTPEQGGNLVPSCQTESGRAYPPRRFVEVAKGFGENAVVQSICQSDFGPAIDLIVGTIGRTVDQACRVD